MSWFFKKGYAWYNSKKNGPVFVAPHSGLPVPSGYRDVGTEGVAYLCSEKAGSSIISMIGRDRVNGIDFYRMMPSEKVAENMFNINHNETEMAELKKKYAWAARNKMEYDQKREIYGSFWNMVVSQESSVYVFVHTQLPLIKNHPSLMDVTTFEGRIFNKMIINEAVKKINEDFASKFKELEKEYNEYMLDYVSDYIFRKKKKYGKFEADSMRGLDRETMLKNLLALKEYCSEEVYYMIKEKFNEEAFITGIKSALNRNNDLCVTVEKNFKGKLAEYVVIPMVKKSRGVGFQVEVSQFLADKHPELAAELIWAILDECNRIVKK